MKIKRYTLFLLLSVMISFSVAAQQTRTVRGVVFDEADKPVIGAVVKIEGTLKATTSGVNGNFTLANVSESDKSLSVSFMGYETQIIDIAGRTDIKVILSTSQTDLGEFVIVGYGVQRKAHLTGAISTVSPADLSDLSSTNLSESLRGLVPGVRVDLNSNRPGNSATLNIRNGNTTNQGPLYVIDDYVYQPEDGETAFNNLDPSMIENISILKDAAAAIYGSRSAAGVVLVRTKRGEIGKPKISYQGQFGHADEFARNKMMDSYNYGLAWNAIRAADPTQTDFDARKDLFQADELEAMKKLNYDLLDKYWSSAFTQRHSVNMSGGTDNMNFFAGVAYNDQDGNLGKINYERWNYRAGVDAKINKWMKASLQVSGDYSSQRRANNKVGGTNDEKDYVSLLTRPRYIPEYLEYNGQQLPVAAYGVSNTRRETTQEYSFTEIENLDNFVLNTPQNMLINASLEYDLGWIDPLKGLKLRGTYSKSINTQKSNEYGSSYTLYRFADGTRGGSGNHLYVDTPDNPMDFSGLITQTVDNGSYLRRRMSRSDNYQLNFFATYARTFGKHSVSGLFTIEKSEREEEYVWGNVTLPYTFTNLQSNGASGDQTTTFNRSEGGTLSYLGRMNYSYADKYLAEFMIRSDASTKFAPENYWGTFYSLSLGWVLSEESWWKNNVTFMDYFKLRGSYGILGRDNVAAWGWMMTYGSEVVKGPIFGSDPSLNAGAHFNVPNTIPNRNSHWDTSHKYNAGFDMGFLSNRLSANIDVYFEQNRETFQSVSSAGNFPTTVGANASASNYGADNKYGVEVGMAWRDKIGKDFKYKIGFNTSWSDNRILVYPWANLTQPALDALLPNQRSDRGTWGYEAIGMFRSYQEIAEYFAQNNLKTYMGNTISDVHPGTLIYRDVRGSQKADGTYYAVGDPDDPKGNVIDANDKVKLSNRSSNIYGFTTNLGAEYKSFAINMQLEASWGSYTTLPSQAINTRSLVSTASGYQVMEYTNLPSFWANDMFVYENVYDASGNIVAYENRDAKYPNLRFSTNGQESTFWMVNNASVMLRNLTVSYTLPKRIVSKMGIESCRLNLTGQNLMEFFNPYPDKFMSPNSSYSKYPTLRRFTLGVNVSF